MIFGIPEHQASAPGPKDNTLIGNMTHHTPKGVVVVIITAAAEAVTLLQERDVPGLFCPFGDKFTEYLLGADCFITKTKLKQTNRNVKPVKKLF